MIKVIKPSEVTGELVLSKYIEKINAILDGHFSPKAIPTVCVYIDLTQIALDCHLPIGEEIINSLISELNASGWKATSENDFSMLKEFSLLEIRKA